jgi:TolB-like protein/DNA-binding winged helix-turn-helix (wHTH) protein/Flp pilus assembly protein TadD
MEASTARVVRFGIFELDAQSGELRRRGLKIRLPAQSFQILQLLLERRGEMVTREELRQRLWTSDTSVDFDVGVNNAVRKLREALDDSAENPRFVETLPRRGYRFIGQVTPDTANQIPGFTAGVAAPSVPRVRAGWIAGALVLAVTIAALTLGYERGWWGRMRAGVAAGPIRSLAVLPFENLTGDPAQEYFVDGMTDALTTDLAQMGGFDVISRASAMHYKGANKRPTAIGHDLNVDALVGGAIVRSGPRVRITAQLIHAATDRHVWANSYESDLSDVVALQQQIARAIAAAIGSRIAQPPPARAGGPTRVDPEAYDAYLKGLQAGGRQMYDGFRTAVAYFKEAVARQPDFAEAYAAMGRAQLQFLWVGPLSPREAIPDAEASARKALELDGTSAVAHRTLGSILTNFYWQWDEAEKEFQRARELNNNMVDEGRTATFIEAGRFDEAIAAAESARKLDPLSFNAYLAVASTYRAAGQYDRAIAEYRRAMDMAPGQSRGNFQLGATFVMMGRSNDGIAELEKAVTISQGNPRFQAYLGYAYAAAGRKADARTILNALESRARQQYVSAFGLALIHDALGEKEPALAALERAYQDRAVEFAQLNQYPPFKTIASEARFQAVMRLVGLPRRTRS